jgi:class 3 adenylate cyclase/YHS domain-containing protein
MPHTFLIADLAGFTALTEAHGDELAADVAEAFIGGMRALLRGHEAHEVKSMGDAVLAHVADADRGLCLAECVIGDLGARHGELGVRVGVHTGPAVSRGDDWFGATVNVTARVAAEAQTDQALVTSATLTAASDGGAAHRTRPLGPRRLRHVSRPVELHALELPTRLHRGLVVDPVCRMAVDPADRGPRLRHDGADRHFCSAHCAAIFARDPELYTERVGGERGRPA